MTKGQLSDEDRHIIDMTTELLPLVEPAKELIDVVINLAKEELSGIS